MLDGSSGDEDDSQEDEEDDEDGEDLESGEYDDPEAADPATDGGHEDSEIDSDEAFADGDEERFKGFVFRGSSKPSLPNGKRARRPVAADFLSSSGEEMSQDDAQDAEDNVDDLRSEESDDEDSDSESHGARRNGIEDSADSDEDDDTSEDEDEGARVARRAQLGQMLDEGSRNVMAPISQSARQEAAKGLAVRQQRRAFDSLLNIRIRLQKALVAVNSLPTVTDSRDAGKEAYEAAEEAALKLWNTIDGFRENLVLPSSVKVGEKRKRSVFDADTPSRDVWEAMDETEGRTGPARKEILDKWSAKVLRPTTAPRRRLIAAPSQTLTSALEDQLLSSGKLIGRTRKPRSCAPAQAARKVDEDADIYDDADFYQVLLKELVEQRSADASAPGAAATTVRWAAVKEAKTRRHVDRKASKGRKLRFNTHEKLQNFMAAEDRTTWEPEAVARFFGTLFGQRTAVEEGDAEDGEADTETGGVSIEEEGLRLFRS